MRPNLKLAAISAAAISTALLSACGESAQTKKETASLKTYFEAYATHSPDKMKPMLTASSPKSDAYLYAKHQLALASADEGTNQATGPEDVSVSHEKVVLGNKPKDKKDATGARTQQPDVYSNFKFDPQGRIITWTTTPGGPLAGRPRSENGSVTSGKVTVKLATAYRTNSGDFMVTYSVRNSGSTKVSVTTSNYINPNGRQVSAATPQGVLEIAPHTYADSYALVTNGKPGGSLLVGFDYMTQKRLPVR